MEWICHPYHWVYRSVTPCLQLCRGRSLQQQLQLVVVYMKATSKLSLDAVRWSNSALWVDSEWIQMYCYSSWIVLSLNELIINYIERYAVNNRTENNADDITNSNESTTSDIRMLFNAVYFHRGRFVNNSCSASNEGLMKRGPLSTFHIFITIL